MQSEIFCVARAITLNSLYIYYRQFAMITCYILCSAVTVYRMNARMNERTHDERITPERYDDKKDDVGHMCI